MAEQAILRESGHTEREFGTRVFSKSNSTRCHSDVLCDYSILETTHLIRSDP
jgi:hypothetical protein